MEPDKDRLQEALDFLDVQVEVNKTGDTPQKYFVGIYYEHPQGDSRFPPLRAWAYTFAKSKKDAKHRARSKLSSTGDKRRLIACYCAELMDHSSLLEKVWVNESFDDNGPPQPAPLLEYLRKARQFYTVLQSAKKPRIRLKSPPEPKQQHHANILALPKPSLARPIEQKTEIATSEDSKEEVSVTRIARTKSKLSASEYMKKFGISEE